MKKMTHLQIVQKLIEEMEDCVYVIEEDDYITIINDYNNINFEFDKKGKLIRIRS